MLAVAEMLVQLGSLETIENQQKLLKENVKKLKFKVYLGKNGK